jgi:predicted O-methyltransferase YrrM
MDQARDQYEALQPVLTKHVDELEKIIVATGKTLEGNSFYQHETLTKRDALVPKQVNLFWAGLQAKTRVCEIGFNAGHSTLLLLLGRDTPLDFTVFDIGHHAYTKPCLEYMKEAFPNVTFEYIEGDSTMKVPQWTANNADRMGTYDVVHVDGGHSEHCIRNDMKNAVRLVAPGGILIIDDTDAPQINKYVDIYLALGEFVEVPICVTPMYPHRMLRRLP